MGRVSRRAEKWQPSGCGDWSYRPRPYRHLFTQFGQQRPALGALSVPLRYGQPVAFDAVAVIQSNPYPACHVINGADFAVFQFNAHQLFPMIKRPFRAECRKLRAPSRV